MSDYPQPNQPKAPIGPRVIDAATGPTMPSHVADSPAPRVIETEQTGPITPADAHSVSISADPAPARRKRRGARVALGGIVIFVFGWLIFDAIDWILSAYARSTALGVVTSTTIIAGILGAGYLIAGELRSFIRLKSVEDIQRRFSGETERISAPNAERSIREILAVIPRTRATDGGIQDFQRQVQVHHTGAQRIEMLSRTVLKPLDEQAKGVVRRVAKQALIIPTLSPTALSEVLFFLALNFRMVRSIAECYGHRPGIVTTANLLRRLLLEATTLGGIDYAVRNIVPQIGNTLGKFGAAAGVATGNPIVVAVGAVTENVIAKVAETLYVDERIVRLGVITMDLCRPIRFGRDDTLSIISLICRRSDEDHARSS